jgi:hypothetical protein
MKLSIIRYDIRRLLSLALCAGTLSLGVLGTSRVARADDVEVEVKVEPPAPRVEVIPAAPSPKHFWIHGYWGWSGGAHVWMPGRYELLRPGWAWTEARWAPVGAGVYHFYPGRWVVR